MHKQLFSNLILLFFFYLLFAAAEQDKATSVPVSDKQSHLCHVLIFDNFRDLGSANSEAHKLNKITLNEACLLSFSAVLHAEVLAFIWHASGFYFVFPLERVRLLLLVVNELLTFITQ